MRYTRRKFKRTYRKARTGRRRSYTRRLARKERNMTDTLVRNIEIDLAAAIVIRNDSVAPLNKMNQLWVDSTRLLLENNEFKHLKILYDEFQINSLRYTIQNIDVPSWQLVSGQPGLIAFLLSTCTDRNGVTFNTTAYSGNGLYMNTGPDILSYGSCKRSNIINSNAYGQGYNYSANKISNSIYASTIVEKQTYLPTTQASSILSGNQDNKNTISELSKMQNIGNAFLPIIGMQINLSRVLTATETGISIPVTIKGNMQITFRGSRNSSNVTDEYTYKDPFRSAQLDPVSQSQTQDILAHQQHQ